MYTHNTALRSPTHTNNLHRKQHSSKHGDKTIGRSPLLTKTSGDSPLGYDGSFARMISNVTFTFSPRNGIFPVTIANRTTPAHQMSTPRASYLCAGEGASVVARKTNRARFDRCKLLSIKVLHIQDTQNVRQVLVCTPPPPSPLPYSVYPPL